MTLALVTGAGGFIGGHLVRTLADSGFDVRATDVKPLADWWQQPPAGVLIRNVLPRFDLKEPGVCTEVCEGADVVFNLAADMGGIGFIENNKARCMMSVLISANMLQAAFDAGVARFFYSSSACVYKQDRQVNNDEPALREQDAYPADPEDGYGWEKLFSERLCRHFREDCGLETRVARYHNVAGPFGSWTGGREKAPAAICRKVAVAVLTGEKAIEVWGDGQQTRTFCYVDDAVTGTLAITSGKYADPVNVGSSELVSIDELIDIVENIASVTLRRTYNRDAPQGVRGRSSDNTLVRELYNWEPATRLIDWMPRLYEWVYDQVRKEMAL